MSGRLVENHEGGRCLDKNLAIARGEIPNGPHAAAEARRFIESVAETIPEPLLDSIRLVATELVTNSYKHAGNPEGHPIEVSLKRQEDRLRLTVIDRSIFDPTPESTSEARAGKWGLVIVDQLADGWGRISEGGIWVEFQLAPSW
jgi:anti-sigma regulatory factor (Ser/Thr protein kinase)